ncbi:metallophosphoesterase [Neorhizobium sp. NPDC001467]|uniref:metallophosphoesterase n=1 Tax=Neorhizobium sp. NPDC001467 TaxID=3390595 RepID=UPI003D07A351
MSRLIPLIRFGVLADPQYAPLPFNAASDRHYSASLDKVAAALARLEHEDLAFVVTLGDLIDRGFENFEKILPLFAASRHECLFLPGNHDFLVANEHLPHIHAVLGMPAPYHHFARNGIRFVIIDGCEESVFATVGNADRHAHVRRRLAGLEAKGAVNAKDWNAGISATQFEWIRDVLDRASWDGEKVVVMGHYPLYPDGDHNLWDSAEVAALIASYSNVIAYLNGHQHRGNLGQLGKTWFVNFKGMVDTRDENAFAIVEIYEDRIEILGYGREDSRSLQL